jgi:hypothetical protein
MAKDFFPQKPDVKPTIYAYELVGVDSHKGLLKVGYTVRSAEERVREQFGTAQIQYRIVLIEDAIRNDGTTFSDHEVHHYLKKKNIKRKDGEWFKCLVKDVRSAINDIRERKFSVETRGLNFKMRPEQKAAVEKTAVYFSNYKKENPGKTPHVLWNAKMRFGKTFAAYQLAKKMGWSKILVMTFKPAVESAWDDDLKEHVDFQGWQFISASQNTLWHKDINEKKPFVCFGSFQDYLGKNKSTGGIKTKNKWVHKTKWDCVIFDEYHYGAWRENAKELFEAEERREQKFAEGQGLEDFDEKILPIKTQAYLYLSGTPFRAIASGEFIEEQIYNWTYSDEQKAKEGWNDAKVVNPYVSLPRMVMMTYQLPDPIIDVANQGEFNEFDLNIFFSAEGKDKKAKFTYEDEVQKWLDLIRGSFLETTIDNLKLGAKKPPMPYSHAKLLNVMNHTLWFLPSVASCYAMRNLLNKRQNSFYHDYKIIVAAGYEAGIGVKALPPVLKEMEDPLESKTITLTCGKLLTGVTVKPWTGIFMLRSCSTPETYFQAAFRVQSPWTIKNPDGKSPNKEEVVKNECYVFDFAPNRALRQIAEYSCRLNVNESNPETKVAEFISFLPVLAYDGSAMKQIDAAGILDMAMSGTTATLLARRWESALLVNVDNGTLKRLMDNKAAMDALMSIEGFRSLNQDIETIINKSEAVEKVKKETNDKELTKKERRELTEEEKKYKTLRKQVQEKLIKFATRIPIFMYLTDYRERTLKDVITKLEPGLFKKVTGLIQKDFEMLVSLGIFNAPRMNDAVYKFKRYEDASLVYTGINRHEDEDIGLFDTVLSRKEYGDKPGEIFVNDPKK